MTIEAQLNRIIELLEAKAGKSAETPLLAPVGTAAPATEQTKPAGTRRRAATTTAAQTAPQTEDTSFLDDAPASTPVLPTIDKETLRAKLVEYSKKVDSKVVIALIEKVSGAKSIGGIPVEKYREVYDATVAAIG